MRKVLILSLLLLLFGSVAAAEQLDIIVYYGKGCPHCARVDETLLSMQADYGLSITDKEIYFDAANRQEMFKVYTDFGLDPAKGGVPTMLLDGRSMIIGEVSEQRFSEIFGLHLENSSVSGIFTENYFSPIEEKDETIELTWAVLIGAALVDSVNPCTIAVMVMLLGVILATDGKEKTLFASLTFIAVIFIAYMLMGLGILKAITTTGATNIFYTVVTIAALVLSVMEINAYFRYKPGFFSVEMPVFLRPTIKKVMGGATSLPGVAVAALFCSFFLLPCSSGPYLLVLGMVAKAVTLQSFFYLVIYNLVFILPMVLIAGSIFIGKTSVEKIGRLKEMYIKEIHLISGLILFLLFLLMLNQMLGIAS